MKKSVTNILDDCQPQELDSILENIGADLPAEADADCIKNLAMQKAGIMTKRNSIRRIILVAACIVLVAAVLVGCYVAEKVEYDSAVKFFDLNNLETDGLSRDDIKRVYRDITTESFSYDKSYELLSANSDTNTVEGLNISISNNTVSNNANLNAITKQDRVLDISSKGVSYLYNSDVGTAEDNSNDDAYTYYKNARIVKLIDGEEDWSADFERDFYIEGYEVRDGKVLVWGEDMVDIKRSYIHTAVALVDDTDGTILWEKTLDTKYNFDEYAIASLSDNGRIAVLTIACDDRFADENTLVFRELDMDGKVVTEHEQTLKKFLFNHLLTPLSDGWLAEIQYEYEVDTTINGTVTAYEPRLVKFSPSGEIIGEWTLSEDSGYVYEIADIMEYDEKLYLSTQSRPSESKMYADVDDEDLDFAVGEELSANFSEEWLDRAREEYSSTLFVLDPKSGKPEAFYTVGGSMPVGHVFGHNQDLSVDGDGNLVWHVGRIVRAGWCPWANSFQINGYTRQYDYTFDRDNELLKQEKTDIFTYYQTM